MAKKNGQLSGQRASTRQRGTTPVSQSASNSPAAISPAAGQPTPEDVARRAYEIFRSRGGVHGRDVEDWLAAERELQPPRH